MFCTWEHLEIRMMDTRTLINKMHGSLTPSDREFALEGCESISRRVRWWPIRRGNLKVISELSGIEMLIDVLKVWLDDMPVATCAVRAITMIASRSQSEADRVLEFGGLAITENCLNVHSDDREVQQATKKLIKVLTSRSSNLAQREIRICCACAMNNVDLKCAIELGRIMSNDRRQRANSAVDSVTRHRSADMASLVRTVLNHMNSHLWSQQVQDAGLDALTEFGRRPTDVEAALLSCNAPEAVVNAMLKHPKSFEVQWKACLAITLMAESSPLASDLGKRGAVKALKLTYTNFNNDREVQQQVMWALGALSTVSTNVERFQREQIQTCVVDVLRRDNDTKIRPEDKVALPLSLRSVWTNKQLEDAVYGAGATSRPKKPTKADKKDEVFATLNPVARHGKGRYNRVSDEYGSGTPGLLD
ncbi:hypothetical protein CTAYLR_008870 [Chrysophaeum taylorii]|uniref:Uncharacterized protein n=1 Tax=Chrysophaeum taylorii TaxID=2483200 RepID=A0AAD7XH35_9STRA|nr:hypothetical protein CTAYLR_008870 [Chrysophaeum taylorii]